MTVLNVDLSIYKTFPPTLRIDAVGLVPTGGWKNGQLIPYVYVQFPPDGIWDFEFVADAPDGPATDVISVITADYLWHAYPTELKGVRVHAVTNSKEALIGQQELISIE